MNMIRLINKASENDPAFGSNNCGRSYKGSERKYLLRRHIHYACGVNPQFHCVYCQKQFRYKQLLQHHVYIVHKQHMA